MVLQELNKDAAAQKGHMRQQRAAAHAAQAALEAEVASRIIQQLPDNIPGLYSKPFTTGKILPYKALLSSVVHSCKGLKSC